MGGMLSRDKVTGKHVWTAVRNGYMLALASVWIGLASLLVAGTMLALRATFSNTGVILVLYFGSPGALCLAGLVLWAHRKEDSSDPGVSAQRLQAKVAIVLGLIAAGIVYALIVAADKITAD